jgi:predicted nuclease of predicted toxin-antitoxin system
MRFLLDETTGPAVAEWLREKGHEVFSVFNEARGMQDVDIIQKAFTPLEIMPRCSLRAGGCSGVRF